MRLNEIFPPDLLRRTSSAARANVADPSYSHMKNYEVNIAGQSYSVGFIENGPGVYIVGIEFEDVPVEQRFKQGHQLFVEMIKLLGTFIKQHHPQRIILTPASSSRAKLYQRLLQRYAPQFEQLGYEVIMPRGDGSAFFLQRVEEAP